MKHPTKAEQDKAFKIWSKIVARAWEDEVFKQRLLRKPEEILKEYGIEALKGVTVKVIEETSSTNYLIIPHKPSAQLLDQELKAIAAGDGRWAMSITE